MLRIHETLCTAIMAAGLALSVGVPVAHAQGYNEQVVYSFTGGKDGAYPQSRLAGDSFGNLYGTANGGGVTTRACAAFSGCGVVFKIASDGTQSVLYSFTGGSDGSVPAGGVIRDGVNTLYSATLYGGVINSVCKRGCGVVYKLASDGTLTVLHTFTGGSDGANPVAGLVRDGQGNLYGVAQLGGSGATNCGALGCGVVFKISRAGQETVLYNFKGRQAGDGYDPQSSLTLDAAGNLYGETWRGGSCCGTVFKLAPDGTETVLHKFKNSDGLGPGGGLVLDLAGNLYGTTEGGGPGGRGVAFKLTPAGKETVLHAFTSGIDGGVPFSGLFRDPAGGLYGTTSAFGANGDGVVFEVAPSGAYRELHTFAGGTDGVAPFSGLIANGSVFYGTTYNGGGASANCPSGCGTIFKLAN